MKTMTTTQMTAPIPTGAWQLVAPVTSPRSEGAVCPQAVATGVEPKGRHGDLAGNAVIDERTFAGTRAWSPPDR